MAVGSYIGQINIGNDTHAIGSTLYGVCTTPAATAAKEATLTGFGDLATGVTVHIKFSNANTVSSGVTLKVGTTSAKPVINVNGSLLWVEESIISFTYDGTSWVINSFQIDTSNITIDVSQLSNLSLGNITNEGKITGHASSLVVTDSNASIVGGATFGNSSDGTYLDNTGAWSTPDKGVTSIKIQTASPVTGGSSTATTASGEYTIALADAYGDTKNPYGTKTANYILAGPASGSAAAPSFRALVDADIPNTIARLASPTFTGTPLITTTPTSGDNSHAIADTAFVIAEINSRLASNDAMLFKGTLGTGGTVTTVPTNGYQAGWTYRVITAGEYAGQQCEIGDLLIAITDGPATGSSVTNAHWTVAQTNIDGSIYMGTNSLTSGQLLVADGTAGKIKTSGYTIAAPTATGDILYASSTSAYNVLSAGTANQVLTMSGGVPTWANAQHEVSHLYVTSSSGTTNTSTALTNGNVYLRLFDTTTARETHKISGAGATTVTTDTSANIIITSTDTQFTSAGSANALTSLTLEYNDGTAQTETPTTATFVGTVTNGVLYLKSIIYDTTSVSTGVAAVTT